VSACPSSPITVITDRVAPTLDRVPPIGLADRVVDGSDGITTADDLLVVLTRIPDPRARRAPASAGQRAGCGGVRGPGRRLLLCRDRRVVHELPISVRVRLGLGRCRLSESTIRRILQAIDADLLDQALCEWLVEEADPDRRAGYRSQRLGIRPRRGRAGCPFVRPTTHRLGRPPLVRAGESSASSNPSAWVKKVIASS
jgi:hypothetical protein